MKKKYKDMTPEERSALRAANEAETAKLHAGPCPKLAPIDPLQHALEGRYNDRHRDDANRRLFRNVGLNWDRK